MSPTLVLVDSGSGLHRNAVYQFHNEVGRRVFVPSKGFGKGRGLSPFYPGKHDPPSRIVGDRWTIARQKSEHRGIALREFDADHWKRWTHERFLTPTLDDGGDYRRGALSLWKPAQSHTHSKFARQVAAEQWVESFEPGKGVKGFWEQVSKDNHWLDALTMACVGASMCGVSIFDGAARRRQPVALGAMQQAARRAG